MDNDTLINQARRLYTSLSIEQYIKTVNDKKRFTRLEHLAIWAYCRYQRRLNRCVLCHQRRIDECSRSPEKNKKRLCPALVILRLSQSKAD